MEHFTAAHCQAADTINGAASKSAMHCSGGVVHSLERFTLPSYHTDLELAWSHGLEDMHGALDDSMIYYNFDVDQPSEAYSWLERQNNAGSAFVEDPLHICSRGGSDDMIPLGMQPYTETGCLCLISQRNVSSKGPIHPLLPPGQPPPPPRPPGHDVRAVSPEPYWLRCPYSLLRQPTTIPVPETREININSKDFEGNTIKLSSVEEDGDSCKMPCGSDSASVPPDSRSPPRESSPTRYKRHSKLKEKLRSIWGKFIGRRRSSETSSVAHILGHEPGDELQLLTGQLGQAELAGISRFAGVWKVDRKVSDSYSTLCKVMQLGWVFRKALTASGTIKIKCTSEELIYKVRVIGIGSFVERRPWSGEKVEHERRDLRRGTVLCSVKRYSQGLALRSEWEGLLGGSCTEYLELSEDARSMVLRLDLYRNTDSATGKEVHMRLVLHRST